MRRGFAALALVLLGGGLALTACSETSSDSRVCVTDPSGTRVPDRECSPHAEPSIAVHWYYLPTGSAPSIGQVASGGSRTRPATVRVDEEPVAPHVAPHMPVVEPHVVIEPHVSVR